MFTHRNLCIEKFRMLLYMTSLLKISKEVFTEKLDHHVGASLSLHQVVNENFLQL